MVIGNVPNFVCLTFFSFFEFSVCFQSPIPSEYSAMYVFTDCVFSVFTHLPPRSIYRFKSASSFISEFSSEPYFALIQAQRSMLRDDPCFIIQKSPFQSYSEKLEIHPLSRDEQSSSVPKNLLEFLGNSSRVLASSNGVRLCRTVGRKPVQLFICNPITKKYLLIPGTKYIQELPPEVDINVVFEYNHGGQDPDECKMVIFENSPEEWSSNFECKVFMPREGRWEASKPFSPGQRRMIFDLPVYLNGSFHFVSDCHPYIQKRSTVNGSINPYYRPYIMAYSTENGSSRMLRVPRAARRGSHDYTCDMRIFKWGKVGSSDQSLCLVQLRKGVFTAWVLVDYESSLWLRLVKIRVKAMGVKEKGFHVTDFIVMNGDYLVFASERKVYGYGLGGENYGAFQEICEHECGWGALLPYSGTLRRLRIRTQQRRIFYH